MATYFDSDRSAEFGFGSARSTAAIRGICIHTTESGKSATATAATADDVTDYQIRTQSGSYHVMVGVDGKRIRQNTDDWVTWSTGNQGNNILLHLCFVGNASQSRAEWLAQDRMLRAAASVVRYWSDRYGIPLRKVPVAALPGICGHDDTRAWGGTDHTDPGPNFPYDKLIEFAQGGSASVKDGALMALTDKQLAELLALTKSNAADVAWIKAQLGPAMDSWGPDSSLGKDAQGRDLTLRDGLARAVRVLDAIARKLGM